jgi:tetratricopeptide (TPR) repeat protein
LRRLNELKLEKYLEEKIVHERRDLAAERAAILQRLDHIVQRRGIARTIGLVLANLILVVSFVMRLLRLGRVGNPVTHAVRLLEVGKLRQARDLLDEVAVDAERVSKLFDKHVESKRFEQRNALLYSGRVSILMGEKDIATTTLGMVQVKGDPSALILMSRQYIEAGDLDRAMLTLEDALKNTALDIVGRAEANRWFSEIHKKRGARVKAIGALRKSMTLYHEANNFLGLASANESIADLLAVNPRHRTAAQTALTEARNNFAIARDQVGAQRVSRKLRKLEGKMEPSPDGWFTAIVDRLAKAIIRRVEKRRAQAETTTA